MADEFYKGACVGMITITVFSCLIMASVKPGKTPLPPLRGGSYITQTDFDQLATAQAAGCH